MPGDRAPPPRASPHAPCRDGRVERPSTKIGWPSRCRRRERAVVRGPRLRNRRATVSASRVAQVVRVPRVVFSTVVVVGCPPRRCGGRRGGRSGAAEQEAEEARSYGIVRWDLGLGGEGVRPKRCLNLEPRHSGLNNFGQKTTYFV